MANLFHNDEGSSYAHLFHSGKDSTNLADGTPCKKNDPYLEAIGKIEELNAHLGMLNVYLIAKPEIRDIVEDIQVDLFIAISDLNRTSPVLAQTHITRLENSIEVFSKVRNVTKDFHNPADAWCQVCRAVCRSAERAFWCIADYPSANRNIGIYLNLLSDLLDILTDVMWLKNDTGTEQSVLGDAEIPELTQAVS